MQKAVPLFRAHCISLSFKIDSLDMQNQQQKHQKLPSPQYLKDSIMVQSLQKVGAHQAAPIGRCWWSSRISQSGTLNLIPNTTNCFVFKHFPFLLRGFLKQSLKRRTLKPEKLYVQFHNCNVLWASSVCVKCDKISALKEWTGLKWWIRFSGPTLSGQSSYSTEKGWVIAVRFAQFKLRNWQQY